MQWRLCRTAVETLTLHTVLANSSLCVGAQRIVFCSLVRGPKRDSATLWTGDSATLWTIASITLHWRLYLSAMDTLACAVKTLPLCALVLCIGDSPRCTGDSGTLHWRLQVLCIRDSGNLHWRLCNSALETSQFCRRGSATPDSRFCHSELETLEFCNGYSGILRWRFCILRGRFLHSTLETLYKALEVLQFCSSAILQWRLSHSIFQRLL